MEGGLDTALVLALAGGGVVGVPVDDFALEGNLTGALWEVAPVGGEPSLALRGELGLLLGEELGGDVDGVGVGIGGDALVELGEVGWLVGLVFDAWHLREETVGIGAVLDDSDLLEGLTDAPFIASLGGGGDTGLVANNLALEGLALWAVLVPEVAGGPEAWLGELALDPLDIGLGDIDGHGYEEVVVVAFQSTYFGKHNGLVESELREDHFG
ncbi:MAG: hypothetical protein ACRC5V_05070 [Aeromonas sp.]